MFIVTGATGELGRRVVDHLLTHVPADQIGVSVRDIAKADDLVDLGVRVRQATYADPDSLRHAFEGAQRIFLVSSNADAGGVDPLPQHRNVIEVAKKVGAERILYTSQMSSSLTAHFPPGRNHAATEKMLEESGLAWTALRHGFYSASALSMNQAGFKAGRIATPQDGKVAWTSHDDLAAADAVLLAGIEEIDGPTPPLTAPRTLDLGDLAAIATEIYGRPVTRELISDEDFKAQLQGFGMPGPVVNILTGFYFAARADEFAQTDPTLQRLLGRAPQTMEAFMRANLPAMAEQL